MGGKTIRARRQVRVAVAVGAATGAATSAGTVRAATPTPTLTTLAAFGYNVPYAGQNPAQGQLAFDAAGNLYGTTLQGGPSGFGAVYELSGVGHRTVTTLATFNGANGTYPSGGLAVDAAGNLYGATSSGGANGVGTLFELSGPGHQTMTTLVTFDTSNGANPAGNLTVDAAGNVYGTTSQGGANGLGTAYQLSGTGHQTLTTLAAFNYSTGVIPESGLTLDAAGNLYGTTSSGGPGGSGTVFELSGPTRQTATVLAAFNGTNGDRPFAAPTLDAAGNLYGTTSQGGRGGDGTVYELSGPTRQTLSTLLTFDGGGNGSYAYGGLTLDAAGDIFGTTSQGGPVGDYGTVFSLTGTGRQTYTTLVDFDPSVGSMPESVLVPDAAGNLYGTTAAGGPGVYGTAFELTGAGFVVPEPASAGVLAVATAGLLGRRRRLA